jgi:hypothetical protein
MTLKDVEHKDKIREIYDENAIKNQKYKEKLKKK